MQKQAMGAPGFQGRPQETNFDTDGRVETVGDGLRGPHPQRQESRQSIHSSLPGSSGHDDSMRRYCSAIKCRIPLNSHTLT